MKNFAAVTRSLLARIRAYQASRSGSPRPPAAAASGDALIYRVAPTTWGVGSAGDERNGIEPVAGAMACCAGPSPGKSRSEPPTVRRPRLSLELTAYGLPVPRGLPAT